MHRLWAVLVCLFVTLFLSGCGPQVGGKQYLIELQSTPNNAAAYVVLWDDWIQQRSLRAQRGLDDSDIAVMRDTEFLAPYRVTEGLTAVTVKRPAYSYVLVVAKDGRFERSTRFTPGEVEHVHVQLPDDGEEP